MSIFTYGLGKNGELGNRKNNDREIIPFKIEGIPECMDASAGGSFSLILSRSGSIWTTGKNKHGRNGNTDSSIFVKISNLPKIKKVSAGYWHSMCLDEQDFIWSTGYNSYGQLGLGHNTNQPVFTRTNTLAVEISAGGYFSLAISTEGLLLSCGTEKNSGHSQVLPTFTPVENISSVSYINAGQMHSGCIANGKLYTWGNNAWGQLGHSNLKSVKTPKQVKNLPDVGIIAVSCSKGEKYGSTGCIDSNGKLYMWGSGYKGKLGLDHHWTHEDPADRCNPEMVLGFDPEVIELGGIHSSAIKNGVVFTWGCGSDGRIGHPEVQGHRYLYKEPLPRPIDNLPKIIKISSSYYHNIILSE